METTKRVFVKVVFILFILCFIVTAFRICAVAYLAVSNKKDGFIKKITAGVDIDGYFSTDKWIDKYPFEEILAERVKRNIVKVEDVIKDHCTTSFPLSSPIHNVMEVYNKKVVCAPDYNVKGKFTEAQMQYALEQTLALKELCDEVGADFVYVVTPTEDSMDYYRGKSPAESKTIWTQRFVDELDENGVETCIVGKELAKKAIAVGYDNSDHWFPDAALAATEVIAGCLNDSTHIEIEFFPEAFKPGNYTDFLADHPEARDNIAKQSKQEYWFPIPITGGEYVLSINEKEVAGGTFEETFMNDPDEKLDLDGAYYKLMKISNTAVNDIVNAQPQQSDGFKILVLGDSYDWPVIAYLASQTGEIAMIYNNSFSGSIRSYIRQFSPDLVMVVYGDHKFRDGSRVDITYDFK